MNILHANEEDKMSDPKMKIEFAPGVLEEMEAEMSNDDLQELLNQIKELVENGTLEENSSEVDMKELFFEDPDLFAILQERRMGLDEEIDNLPKPILH
jgi:UTP-glucose-1-phosphate uridylyltransferase